MCSINVALQLHWIFCSVPWGQIGFRIRACLYGSLDSASTDKLLLNSPPMMRADTAKSIGRCWAATGLATEPVRWREEAKSELVGQCPKCGWRLEMGPVPRPHHATLSYIYIHITIFCCKVVSFLNSRLTDYTILLIGQPRIMPLRHLVNPWLGLSFSSYVLGKPRGWQWMNHKWFNQLVHLVDHKYMVNGFSRMNHCKISWQSDK